MCTTTQTGGTKEMDPSVFESPLSMDEYEKTFKRGLVQTLEIISSEFSSRIRQEDSVQDTQENLISFYS